MAKIKQHTAEAQNSFSTKFPLDGRSARISFSGTSAVTIRMYALWDATEVLATQTVDNPITEFNPVLRGLFDVGVATGDYVGSTKITVEQD